jgi:hypothetical protein
MTGKVSSEALFQLFLNNINQQMMDDQTNNLLEMKDQ